MIVEFVVIGAVGVICQLVGFKVATKISNKKQELQQEKDKQLSDSLLAANQLLEEELANKTQMALDVAQGSCSKSELIDLLLASPDLRKDAIDTIRKEIKQELVPQGAINFVYRHDWKYVSADKFVGAQCADQKDTLTVKQCSKCDLKSRQWEVGFFQVPKAGYFRGGKEIVELQQQMFCCLPDKK